MSKHVKAREQTYAKLRSTVDDHEHADALVFVSPTQVRRPWRATLRTVIQMSLALVTLLPFVLSDLYDDPEAMPAAVAQVLVFSGIFTRIMAMPQVEAFLQEFVPFLSAAPSAPVAGNDQPGAHRTEVRPEAGAIDPIVALLIALLVVVLLFLLLPLGGVGGNGRC